MRFETLQRLTYVLTPLQNQLLLQIVGFLGLNKLDRLDVRAAASDTAVEQLLLGIEMCDFATLPEVVDDGAVDCVILIAKSYESCCRLPALQ